MSDYSSEEFTWSVPYPSTPPFFVVKQGDKILHMINTNSIVRVLPAGEKCVVLLDTSVPEAYRRVELDMSAEKVAKALGYKIGDK